MTPKFLGSNRNTDAETDISDSNSYHTPLPVASLVSLTMPMGAALSHSLGKQEKPDDYFPPVPVASPLGKNLRDADTSLHGVLFLAFISALATPPIMPFSPCGPNDHQRSKMVFKTRCFCSSTNKAPNESLIVVRCAMGMRGTGTAPGRGRTDKEQELTPWENTREKLPSARLKSPSSQARPRKSVQRGQGLVRNPASSVTGRRENRQGAHSPV